MVFLGIYDELFSLYTDVIQIYEEIIIKQNKAHQGIKLQWYEYDQYASKRVRERINRSLWKRKYLNLRRNMNGVLFADPTGQRDPTGLRMADTGWFRLSRNLMDG